MRTALAPWLFAAAIVVPGVPTNPNLPITTSCWIEARPFESLRFGVFDSDPGIRPSCHQFVAYKAVWDEIPDDGLPRFDERRPPDV